MLAALLTAAFLPTMANGQTKSRSKGTFGPVQPGQFGPRFVPPEGFPPANFAEAMEQASVLGKDSVSVAAVRLTPLPEKPYYPVILMAVKIEGPRAKTLATTWDEKGGNSLPRLFDLDSGDECEIVIRSLITGRMMEGIADDPSERLGLHFIVPRGTKGPFHLLLPACLPAATDSTIAFQFRVLSTCSSAPPHDEPKVNDALPKSLPAVAGNRAVKFQPKPKPKPAEPLDLKATHIVTPRAVGTTTVPVAAGKGGRYVEAYEEGTVAERAKLVKDGEVFLIDVPTPVAVESTRAGWSYCRPTAGPHKGKFMTVREKVLSATK